MDFWKESNEGYTFVNLTTPEVLTDYGGPMWA
jgi:hypothetical protein